MSDSDPTAAELLTAVNVAINGLLSSKFKQTTVNGRTYTLQDLGALQNLRKELRREVNSNSSSSVRLGDMSGTY